MAAVELPQQLDAEITRFAETRGVSKADVITEAVQRFLEDTADIEAAKAAIAEGGRTYSSREVRSLLGLEN